MKTLSLKLLHLALEGRQLLLRESQYRQRLSCTRLLQVDLVLRVRGKPEASQVLEGGNYARRLLGGGGRERHTKTSLMDLLASKGRRSLARRKRTPNQVGKEDIRL